MRLKAVSMFPIPGRIHQFVDERGKAASLIERIDEITALDLRDHVGNWFRDFAALIEMDTFAERAIHDAQVAIDVLVDHFRTQLFPVRAPELAGLKADAIEKVVAVDVSLGELPARG